MKQNDATIFAETTFRNQHQRFGIYRQDRRYHMAIAVLHVLVEIPAGRAGIAGEKQAWEKAR